MLLSTFAVWGFNLPKPDLFIGVKLLTILTQPDKLAIEASQLYFYAITLLIKGFSLIDVINMTKSEIKQPLIKEWFERAIKVKDRN